MPHNVTSISQKTEFGSDGVARPVYELTFTVDDQGPFTLSTPVEGYTAIKGNQLVQEKAAEILKTLQG